MAYTKLFSSILDSTIWQEPPATKLVWITLIAMADRNGEIQASIPGLAARSGVPLSDCEIAIEKLLSPDKYSRTKDDEGRRIEEIDGGWLLLNHAKYRDMASDDDRKEKAAIRARRHYEKAKRNGKPNGKPNACLTPSSRQISQAEAEAEAEAVRSAPPFPVFIPSNVPSPSEPATATPPLAKRAKGFEEGNHPGLLPTTDQAKRFANLMHRKLSTPWTSKEVAAYKRIGTLPEDDLAALEKYYSQNWPPKSEVNILRHDLITLLHNIPGEIGRAHAQEQPTGRTETKRPSAIAIYAK